MKRRIAKKIERKIAAGETSLRGYTQQTAQKAAKNYASSSEAPG